MDIELTHEGVRIRILQGPYVDIYGNKPTAQAAEYYVLLCDSLNRYREFAADKILKLFNDNWADEEDGVPQVDRAGFIANLVNPTITLYDEIGAAVIYFEDSDMFAGHYIEVHIENGVATNANLIG